MDKVQIIDEFIEINCISRESPVADFNAIVEYVGYSISDVTRIMLKLDTYNYGDIEVFPTNRIDINKVHTGFTVRFCEYSLENQTLVIKGIAHPSKGGKSYAVRITPC